MDASQGIWFKAKKYGWGWGAATTWQGWAVYAAYILLGAVGALELLPSHAPAFVAAFTALSAVVIAVCWWKGEKPAWHWGTR